MPARVRLDDRQDHRARPHARGGDRAPAPGDRRHDGGDRGGHDQPGLPARAARPPRARATARSTPAGWTASRCQGEVQSNAPRRRRARPRRDRAVRRRDRHRARPASMRSPGAGRPRPSRRGPAHRRPALPAARATASSVSQIGPHRYVLEVDGSRIEAELERVSEHERLISFGAGAYRTLTALQDADLLVEVDGVPHRISRDEGGLIRCPSPGVVVAIPVSAGDEVQAGRRGCGHGEHEDGVVADRAGRAAACARCSCRRQHTRPVAGGRCCRSSRWRITRPSMRASGFASSRPRLTTSAEPSALDRLEWLLLGYDVSDVRGGPDARRVPGRLRRIPPPSAGCSRSTRICARSAAPTATDAPQPAAVPARVPALARPRRRGSARALRGRSRARAAPLRGRAAWSAPPRSKPPATGCFCRASAPAPPAARSARSSSAASNRRATARPRERRAARGARPAGGRAAPRPEPVWPSSRARCAGAAATSR